MTGRPGISGAPDPPAKYSVVKDQRYYATGAGRFMSADPYKASAGGRASRGRGIGTRMFQVTQSITLTRRAWLLANLCMISVEWSRFIVLQTAA